MFKNNFIRFWAYLLPLGVVFFYARFFGKIGMGGISCTFYKFSGFYCPGCGGQRAFKALLHGDFINAAHSNVLIFVLIPFFLWCYVVLVESHWLKNKSRFFNIELPNTVVYGVLASLLLFFVFRNIPHEPFVYLIPQ